MKTKTCTTCKLNKPLSEFHKCKKSYLGHKSVCKLCRKKESKEYCSRDYVINRNKENYQKDKEVIRKRLKIYYWTLTSQYHEYVKRAKKSNIEFSLTKDDCKNFYQVNCYYCNDKIKGLGIDRVNNEIGYNIKNCVPCCSTCNFMKRTLTQKKFFEKIKQICTHKQL